MRAFGQAENPAAPSSGPQGPGPACPGALGRRPIERTHAFAYDLRIAAADSAPFYAGVAGFSARVVAEIERRAAHALDGYSSHLSGGRAEAPRSRGEYGLELLTVGMAVRLYGGPAMRTPAPVVALARALYSLRRRWPLLKPVADFLRAGIFQLFMRPGGGRAGSARRSKKPGEYRHLLRLTKWLAATGEFEQECRRIANWSGYWRGLPPAYARTEFALALELFDWFQREAEQALGRYTAGVIPFLEGAYAKRFWREDQLFCGRLPAEYHLGMVASEVMNQGLSDAFHARPRKVVLVPACMRGPRAQTCKAVTRGLDIVCAGCDPECAINRITRRMRRHGIQVYMVPHSSGFSRWLERWQRDSNVGVAAVACMMNILAGGYEMRARGIASQCVPLDFPGCEKHWQDEPVATGVNEQRLVQIVTA